MLAASEAPPERHFLQPRVLIPAKRHMGTPHVAKIVANFVFFKIFCFVFFVFFSKYHFFHTFWNSYRYGGMGRPLPGPSRGAPGRSLGAPGRPRNAPGRPRAPPGAHVPAKRPTILQKVAMMVFCKAPIGHTDFCALFGALFGDTFGPEAYGTAIF